MTDPTAPRPARRTTISGVAGLFGLLTGAMAIFALIVAAMDWRDEAAQADWPIASAVVDRGDVTASRAPRDGGGMAWKLRYVVRYMADDEERSVTLRSRSALSEAEAAKLRVWATRHRRGSYIDVRYDPAQPNRAIFASADVPNAGTRTTADLLPGLIFAMACVGLLALAKHLRLREAQTISAGQPDRISPAARIALGILSAAPGFAVIGAALAAAIQGTAPPAGESLIALPAGLIFIFGGAFLALPPGHDRWRGLLAALLVTCFALTFDWIAFGPGERRFGGGFSLGPIGEAFRPGEFSGRTAFGIVAVFLDIFALLLWIDQCRRLLRPAANAPASMERDTQ